MRRHNIDSACLFGSPPPVVTHTLKILGRGRPLGTTLLRAVSARVIKICKSDEVPAKLRNETAPCPLPDNHRSRAHSDIFHHRRSGELHTIQPYIHPGHHGSQGRIGKAVFHYIFKRNTP